MTAKPLLERLARQAIVAGVAEWLARRPLSKRTRTLRKARRKQRKGKELTDEERAVLAASAVNGDYFNDDEVTPMLQGYKSATGLIAMLIGFVLNAFGIGDCPPDALECVTSEAVTTSIMTAIDKIIMGFGMLFTAWGVIHKALRERKLKRELEAVKNAAK